MSSQQTPKSGAGSSGTASSNTASGDGGDHLSPGSLVFAKMKSFPPWPAKVISAEEYPGSVPRNHVPVLFLGSGDYGHVSTKECFPYVEYRSQYGTPKQRPKHAEAIREAEELISSQQKQHQQTRKRGAPKGREQEKSTASAPPSAKKPRGKATKAKAGAEESGQTPASQPTVLHHDEEDLPASQLAEIAASTVFEPESHTVITLGEDTSSKKDPSPHRGGSDDDDEEYVDDAISNVVRQLEELEKLEADEQRHSEAKTASPAPVSEKKTQSEDTPATEPKRRGRHMKTVSTTEPGASTTLSRPQTLATSATTVPSRVPHQRSMSETTDDGRGALSSGSETPLSGNELGKRRHKPKIMSEYFLEYDYSSPRAHKKSESSTGPGAVVVAAASSTPSFSAQASKGHQPKTPKSPAVDRSTKTTTVRGKKSGAGSSKSTKDMEKAALEAEVERVKMAAEENPAEHQSPHEQQFWQRNDTFPDLPFDDSMFEVTVDVEEAPSGGHSALIGETSTTAGVAAKRRRDAAEAAKEKERLKNKEKLKVKFLKGLLPAPKSVKVTSSPGDKRKKKEKATAAALAKKKPLAAVGKMMKVKIAKKRATKAAKVVAAAELKQKKKRSAFSVAAAELKEQKKRPEFSFAAAELKEQKKRPEFSVGAAELMEHLPQRSEFSVAPVPVEVKEQKKRGRKPKGQETDKKPKHEKRISGYSLWAEIQMPVLRQERPDLKGLRQIHEILKERFNQLPELERKMWNDKAQVEKNKRLAAKGLPPKLGKSQQQQTPTPSVSACVIGDGKTFYARLAGTSTSPKGFTPSSAGSSRMFVMSSLHGLSPNIEVQQQPQLGYEQGAVLDNQESVYQMGASSATYGSINDPNIQVAYGPGYGMQGQQEYPQALAVTPAKRPRGRPPKNPRPNDPRQQQIIPRPQFRLADASPQASPLGYQGVSAVPKGLKTLKTPKKEGAAAKKAAKQQSKPPLKILTAGQRRLPFQMRSPPAGMHSQNQALVAGMDEPPVPEAMSHEELVYDSETAAMAAAAAAAMDIGNTGMVSGDGMVEHMGYVDQHGQHELDDETGAAVSYLEADQSPTKSKDQVEDERAAKKRESRRRSRAKQRATKEQKKTVQHPGQQQTSQGQMAGQYGNDEGAYADQSVVTAPPAAYEDAYVEPRPTEEETSMFFFGTTQDVQALLEMRNAPAAMEGQCRWWLADEADPELLGGKSKARGASPPRPLTAEPLDAAAVFKLIGRTFENVGNQLMREEGEDTPHEVAAGMDMLLDGLVSSVSHLLTLTGSIPPFDRRYRRDVAARLVEDTSMMIPL